MIGIIPLQQYFDNASSRMCPPKRGFLVVKFAHPSACTGVSICNPLRYKMLTHRFLAYQTETPLPRCCYVCVPGESSHPHPSAHVVAPSFPEHQRLSFWRACCEGGLCPWPWKTESHFVMGNFSCRYACRHQEQTPRGCFGTTVFIM